MSDNPNEQLIEEYRHGNIQSFNELKQRHKSKLTAAASRYAASGVPLPALEGESLQLFLSAVHNSGKINVWKHAKKSDVL